MPPILKTPGVYIEEVTASPKAVEAVATAIPAFVGYTPKASYEGQSYLNKPTKITSLDDFRAIFLHPDPPPPAPATSQYSPQYYITKQQKKPAKGSSYELNGSLYTVEPDPGTLYYLYNSIRLFYANGGGTAYIVSVGPYGEPTKSPVSAGDLIINPNVKLSELSAGIAALKEAQEVTMYLVPEATLLSRDDNSTLMQEMLAQNGKMGTAVSIFDIIGGAAPDPVLYTQDIESFRNSTGSDSLKYGVAYYPFLRTSITQASEVDYNNLNGGDTSGLAELVNPPDASNAQAEQILKNMQSPADGMTPSQLNQAMMTASEPYKQLMDILQERINTLPPSGAMAGIYTWIDHASGVWNAPANVTPERAVGLTLDIDESMQANLNIDAKHGKSINAIRFFNGRGVLIWGARTLDGNSDDWRYVSVRRTAIMIEQSARQALHQFAFSSNDANTWAAAQSLLNNFLTGLWREGALQGSKPGDAFDVQIGLGTTMTSQDLLEGIMKASVKIAIMYPAGFLNINIAQKMAEH